MSSLKDFSYYSQDKIPNSLLTKYTYIGVDNLIPNKGGVKESDYVPSTGYSTIFKQGDILVGNIRPYFKKIWLATFDGGCSADVLCIRPYNSSFSKYLFSCLSDDSFFRYDTAGSKGSKMPRGDKNHIMNYPINFPDNYDKIGELLVNLDQQIMKNTAMVQKLQVLGKIIYCQNITNVSFSKLAHISSITTGSEDVNHSCPNGNYNFFTCSEEILKCNDYKFEGKSILIAGNGNFNAKYYDGKFNAYQRTYVIKNDRIIGNLYYSLVLNSILFKKKANGSIVKFITMDMLGKIKIPNFRVDVNNTLNILVDEINRIVKNTNYMLILKNKLLPLLINGQLK